METNLYHLRKLLGQPQQYRVPLFQRGYAWKLDVQWEPLWEDVKAVADSVLEGEPVPHFLGAVVLQAQASSQPGELAKWDVIDGQQRLTTLQILIHAVSGVLLELGHRKPAMRLRSLVENDEVDREVADDRFKLLPTDRDQAAYRNVMTIDGPVDHAAGDHRSTLIGGAHGFFTHAARDYLSSEDAEQVRVLASALADAILLHIQIVGITLLSEENAQVIFETMNARMTPLQPTDLIKSLLFQRIQSQGGEVRSAYTEYWADFEDDFWEEEITSGRFTRPRFTTFMNHWLVSHLAKDVPPAEVFREFKKLLDRKGGDSALAVLQSLRLSGDSYREMIQAQYGEGPVEGVPLFIYRVVTSMEMSVVMPVVMWLTDPTREEIAPDQLTSALAGLESWAVRRLLIRGTAKGYNRILVDLLSSLQAGERQTSGDTVSLFFRGMNADSSFWPGDKVVTEGLRGAPVYKTIARKRLRMLLEALEDHRRGFVSHHPRQALVRVSRQSSRTSVEHVMPQEWRRNWPAPGIDQEQRDSSVQTLGNLVLLPSRFNASVSNGPWGDGLTKGKRAAFKSDVIDLLTRDVADSATWDEESIALRSENLISALLEIWPVPSGHSGELQWVDPSAKVSLSDLLDAGKLSVGQTLTARGLAMTGFGRVLATGDIEVDGRAYGSASAAAEAARGRGGSVNGMYFWMIDKGAGLSLGDVRDEFVVESERKAGVS